MGGWDEGDSAHGLDHTTGGSPSTTREGSLSDRNKKRELVVGGARSVRLGTRATKRSQLKNER